MEVRQSLLKVVIGLVCIVAIVHCESAATKELKLGSFNIQVFGESKMSNELVVKVLVKILTRYDIVFVQEIRDSSDSAIHKLVALLKAETEVNYQLSLSERLGRSDSKEQYAFIYNPAKVNVLKSFQFEDKKGLFERPPYSLLLESPSEATVAFFTGVHVKPDNAPQEISDLVQVYEEYASSSDDLVAKTIRTNWLLMGDMNADCKYVHESDWKDIKLYTDSRFTWLIKTGEDTTVADKPCAYDRFVTTNNGTWVQSVDIYDFGKAFKLDEEEEKKVSDHKPIEIRLNWK